MGEEGESSPCEVVDSFPTPLTENAEYLFRSNATSVTRFGTKTTTLLEVPCSCRPLPAELSSASSSSRECVSGRSREELLPQSLRIPCPGIGEERSASNRISAFAPAFLMEKSSDLESAEPLHRPFLDEKRAPLARMQRLSVHHLTPDPLVRPLPPHDEPSP